MPFPIETTFRGTRVRPSVEQQIQEWAAKLETAYDGIMRCDVIVEAPHRHQRKGRQYHVRINLTLPGEVIAISHDPGPDETHQDVHVAVRDAFHAARRRLEDWVRRDLHRDQRQRELSHGRVTYLDVQREWGYLDAPDGHRVYFHQHSVIGDRDRLAVGDEVRFAEEPGDHGPQASSVLPLGLHGHHELPPVAR